MNNVKIEVVSYAGDILCINYARCTVHDRHYIMTRDRPADFSSESLRHAKPEHLASLLP